MRLSVILVVVSLSYGNATADEEKEAAAELDRRADGYRNAGLTMLGLGVVGVVGGQIAIRVGAAQARETEDFIIEGETVLGAAATGLGVVLGVGSLYYFSKSTALRRDAELMRRVTVTPIDGGATIGLSGTF